MRAALYSKWILALLLSSVAGFVYAEPVTDPQATIMRKASDMKMTKLEYLNSGVYGKRNNSVMYFIHRSQLRDLDTFYGTMVQVLSEKYGCLMRSRVKRSGYYGFNCRDGRYIVINHGVEGNTYFFSSKRYDRSGEEIFVQSDRHDVES